MKRKKERKKERKEKVNHDRIIVTAQDWTAAIAGPDSNVDQVEAVWQETPIRIMIEEVGD